MLVQGTGEIKKGTGNETEIKVKKNQLRNVCQRKILRTFLVPQT